MKVFSNLRVCSQSQNTISLTIGNFDGVHIGHQTLLKRLKSVASYCIGITFSNHPSEILHKSSVLYLTTLEHRLALFEKFGLDEVFLTPFSETFSKQSAADFLTLVKRSIPFTHLILGHDAQIGHDKKKDLIDLARALHFSIENIPPVKINGKIVSSSSIRKNIQAGELDEVKLSLGRPYSIFATVKPGRGKGASLGFPTANLPVAELALPPFGVYAVQVNHHHLSYPAVANLGYAPTLHHNRPPCLEVHLIDQQQDLYGKSLEVLFLKFLRPERTFESLEALKAQIRQDVHAAKVLFQSLSPDFSRFLEENRHYGA